jgi:indolepyruvate ferredoxin oxidoreductase
VYVQTCAAEKRRRRKKGEFPDPDKRVFINTDVCEGCGDCGVQSNCVSIVPVETELGTKRAIDQSSCNKDFSCLSGFCPSFVTIEGAMPRKNATEVLDLPHLPEPELPTIHGTHNIVVTGVGGTGVVTIGAIIAMAAHIDGKGAGMMEMAGLAQKGGAVHVHCRIGESPADINAIRVAVGECDALIGGDLVVSAGSKTLALTTTGRTRAAVNGHEIITGDFTRDPNFRLPVDKLRVSLEARLRDGLAVFDASELARKYLGDSVYSNMVTFGASWQQGAIPLSHASILEAIALNGAAVERNKRAFEIGRWAILHPKDASTIGTSTGAGKTLSLKEKVDFRVARLEVYQGPALAEKYRRMVGRFEGPALQNAVAEGYFKVLAYKDEYEVARLHLETLKKAEAEFEGDLKMSWHMAPPLISPMGANGRPKKRRFGSAFAALWPGLARLKVVRGTPFDPFGYTAERRMERAMIAEFEQDMELLLGQESPVDPDAAIALALLPLQVRGFGPVKMKNREVAAKRRAELLDALARPAPKAAAE